MIKAKFGVVLILVVLVGLSLQHPHANKHLILHKMFGM